MSRKILLCRVDGNFGGVERFILSLIRYLDPERYMPVVAPISNDDELARQSRSFGVPTEFLPMRSRLQIGKAAKNLVEIAQKHNAELIHTFGLRSNTLANQARHTYKFPWIIRLPNVNTTDYTNPLRGWFSHWLNNRWIRNSDALQVISPQLEEYVLRWKQPPRAIYNIPNGVDIQRYEELAAEFDARKFLKIPEFAPVIGSMGRMDPIKGFDLLIRVYKQILQHYPEARLLLVGAGKEQKKLERLCQELKFKNQVIITGFQENPVPYLAAMNVYVCSSHSEGVPNAMMEAMAMRLPILSTKVGGIESIVTDDENGLLIQPGDEQTLLEKLLELLESENKRIRLGNAAYHTIERNYSAERMAHKVQAMYDEVIKKYQKRI